MHGGRTADLIKRTWSVVSSISVKPWSHLPPQLWHNQSEIEIHRYTHLHQPQCLRGQHNYRSTTFIHATGSPTPWKPLTFWPKLIPHKDTSRSNSAPNLVTLYSVVFTARRRYAQRVLATATWLAAWVAGCPTHASIVSKRLNLS